MDEPPVASIPIEQPFEKRTDEASPTTVTALLDSGLPGGIVLPPALLEAADPKITSSRRKHRHKETSAYRKSAGRHDTILLPTTPSSSAAGLWMLKAAEMDGHNLEARHSSTAYSPQSTAPAPVVVQLVLPGEGPRQSIRSGDSTPSSQSSRSSESRRSSRWADKVASRAEQAARAEAARAAKPVTGSWNWWLGASARETVRTFYGS